MKLKFINFNYLDNMYYYQQTLYTFVLFNMTSDKINGFLKKLKYFYMPIMNYQKGILRKQFHSQLLQKE